MPVPWATGEIVPVHPGTAGPSLDRLRVQHFALCSHQYCDSRISRWNARRTLLQLFDGEKAWHGPIEALVHELLSYWRSRLLLVLLLGGIEFPTHSPQHYQRRSDIPGPCCAEWSMSGWPFCEPIFAKFLLLLPVGLPVQSKLIQPSYAPVHKHLEKDVLKATQQME